MPFNHQVTEPEISDYWDHLGKRKRRLLDGGWSGVFRHCLLSKLPLSELKALFNKGFGRPTKDLGMVVGTLILQQLHDLTDQETVEAISFNVSWHYALDIQNPDDAYLCERTLRNYKRKLIDGGVYKKLFATLTGTLAETYGVNTARQRIDSTAIKSAMKLMTRLEILVASIRKFFRELRQKNSSLFLDGGSEYAKRYLGKKSKFGCFDSTTPRERKRLLPEVSQDAFAVLNHYCNTQAAQMESYKILIRVFHEQCKITDQSSVAINQPKEIPCDNVQNPSDPDASYNKHKGTGYIVQVMETYGEDDSNGETKSLDLVTHVSVNKMTVRDGHRLDSALCDVAERGLKPKQLLGDSHYGSRENLKEATIHGLALIYPAATAKGAKAGVLTLDRFTFDSDGMVTSCPMGKAPQGSVKGKKRFLVRFPKDMCVTCPHVGNCAVTAAIKRGEGPRIQYDPGRVEYSLRRQYNQSEEFKAIYRWRAGIEATMSRLKYQMNMAQLRVRGEKSIQYIVYLRALGLNIKRCAGRVGIFITDFSWPIQITFPEIQRMKNPLKIRMLSLSAHLSNILLTPQM